MVLTHGIPPGEDACGEMRPLGATNGNLRTKCLCNIILYSDVFPNEHGGKNLRPICHRNTVDETKLLTCRGIRFPVHVVCLRP